MGGMDGARLEGVMTNLNGVLQRAAVPGLPKGPTGKILRREVQPPEELQ